MVDAKLEAPVRAAESGDSPPSPVAAEMAPDRKAVRLHLARLLDEGRRLQAGCTVDGPTTEDEGNEWFSRVQNYVREQFDESYVIRLKHQDDLTLYSGGMEGQRLKFCNGLKVVVFQLGRLIDRIP